MNQKLYSPITWFLVIFLLGAQMVSAATITVMNSNDAGAGSLRQAVIDAVAGDDIVFDAATDGIPILLSTEIVIDKMLTITGNGTGITILSGDNSSRIFNIMNAGDVTLAAMDLIDGVEVDGGAIFNNMTNLTINDALLSGNDATGAAGSGGAIFHDGLGSDLNINNSTLSNNTAVRAGGAIESRGGTMTIISNSILDGNTASTSPGNGGGMHITGNGSLNFMSSTASNNTAASEGGGLWNGTGFMLLSGSTINNNTANGTDATNGGGGVFNAGGTLSVMAGTMVLDNDALMGSGSGGGIFNDGGTMVVGNSTISGNDASRAGGGIEATAGSMSTLNNATLVNNSAGASPGNGGGMHITGNGNLDITGGSVTGNVATRKGGGLWNGSGVMNVAGVTIANNEAQGPAADDGGGGIFNNGGTLNVTNGTLITNNMATGAAGSGGGILHTGLGADLNVTNSTISFNTAIRAGGGIESTGGTMTIITTSLLDNNTVGAAPGNGGGMHITGNGSLNFMSSTASNNTAASEGGGLWNGTGFMLLDGSTISNNTANGMGADNGGGGVFNAGGTLSVMDGTMILNNNALMGSASGGGIFNDAGGLMVVGNSTISGNNASRAGGGIEATAGTTNTLNNATLANNSAGASPGNGGGMHITGNGNLDITGGSVTGNIATREGGGLWNGSGVMNVAGVTIANNEAQGPAADDGGGGIFNNSGTLNVTNGTLITNNMATGAAGSGGGIFHTGLGADLNVTNSTISFNTAIRAGGGIESTGGTMTVITTSTLDNNSVGAAPGNGGGMHITGNGSLNFMSSTASNNTAASEGGGLWNGSGFMLLDGSTVINNVANGMAADNGGGGVFNAGGTLSVMNGTNILDNDALMGSASGGGILNDAGGLMVVGNSTISGNESSRAGGGIEVTAGTMNILNNATLSNNSTGAAPGNGGGLHITGNGNLDYNGGLVIANTAASEGGGLWNGTGVMNITGVNIEANNANGNDADNGGGGVFNAGGVVNISGANIIANNANGTAGSGGGILNDAMGTVIIDNSNINNNTSNRAGGGIEATAGTTTNITGGQLNANNTGASPGNGGGLHITGNGNAMLTGGQVNANVAASEGGGLWNGAGMMTVDGVLIASNVANGADATNGGGGVFNAGGMVTISNGTTITSNTAAGTSGSGGGVFNDANGTVDVSNSLIVSNVSNRAGGGIEATAGTTTNLTNVELNSNTTGAAPGNGGGMHITGAGNATITGGLVNSNTAASEGGGLWNGSGMMTISGTLIASNNANGTDATNGGGGVFNAGGTVTINGNTIITDNRALVGSGSGGGVFNDGGTVSIDGGEITVNQSNRAGGGIEATAGSMTTLTNVLLNSNTTGTAPGNGGGMHITGAGNATITGGTVNSNTAAREGGGLWNGSGMMTVDGVTVASNAANGAAADDGGGGIFNNGGTLTIQNGTVVDNNTATTGSGSGGGIFSNGGMVNVTSSTIVNNTANRAGGGVEVTGGVFNLGDVNLISNIVNNSPGNGGGLHITGAATVNVDVSRVNNNSAGNEGGGLWGSGAGMLNVSNTTVRDNTAPDGGGLFLQAGSGSMTVTNSTVSGNNATNGGGVQVEGGTFTSLSSTVANNTATSNGGGFNVTAGSVFTTNTIIGDNSAAVGADFNGNFAMAMNSLLENPANATGIMNMVNGNVVGFDPMLNPLANNGGTTLTHLPNGASPALDRGTASGLALDQRLANRVAVVTEDMGSVEVQVGQLSNDVCAGAVQINCDDLLFGTTETATAADAPAGCAADTDTQAGVWFTFTGNGQTMAISTDNAGTNFDTELNVYSGTCGNLVCVGADDNSGANGTSTVAIASTAGTTYFVYVDGEAGAIGQFQLSLVCCDAPVAACQSTTVILDPITGTAALTPADIDAGSTADCGVASLTVLPSTLVCGNVPTALATLTITDIFGFSDQCQVTINVIDNTDPNLVCMDASVDLDANGMASITEVDVIANNTDACGIASTSISQTAFDCSNVGPNVVTVTSVDNNGNSSTCTATVTVNDAFAPVIGCRPTIHTTADDNLCGKADLILLDPFVFEENCSVVITNDAPAVFSVGTTVITWTVTDAGNNQTTCTQDVIIQDLTPPVIECGYSFTAFTTDTQCSYPSSLLDPTTATDNCGIASITSDAPASFGPGNYMVNFVATDVNGNESTCMQWVKVMDNTAPTITSCPDNIEVESTETDGSAQAFFATPTAVDACGPIILTQSNFDSGDFFPLGDTEVEFSLFDGSANPAVCSFVVSVVEVGALSINLSCLDNIQVSNDDVQVWNEINWNPPLMTSQCETCEVMESEEFNFIGSLSGHQYYVYTGEPMTWEAAKEYAEDLGAYLVVIDNEKEEVMLQNEIEDGVYFTGLVDMEGLGEFDWTTDGEIDEEIFVDLANEFETPATVVLDEEDKWTVVDLEETTGQFIFEFNCINMEMTAEIPSDDDDVPPTQVEGDDELAFGTTAQVTYTIEDQCGNVASCGFEVAIFEEAVDYCASGGVASDEENPFFIESFQMGDIVVDSGQDEGGYGDMTDNKFILTAGQDIQLGAIYSPENNDLPLYCRIWIDLNNDGDFFDENELWMQGVDFDVMSAEAIVPAELVENTRLRIAIARLTYPESCGDFMDGEVEDYTVTIVEPADNTEGLFGGFNNTNTGNTGAISMEVFPNPADAQLFVKVQNIEEENAVMEVFNSLGQQMVSRELGMTESQTIPLNIEDFSNGIYTILIHGQNGLELTQKFVKGNTELRP